MTPRRKLLAAAVPAVVVLLAVWAPGGTDRYDGQRAGSPGWTSACWERSPRQDRALLSRCARVSGRVLWVRRQGRGASSKAHVVLASGFGVVLAKMTPYAGRHVPAIGHWVTVVGPLVRSRAGVTEVQYFGEL
jgi:hypothetical protein